MTEQDSFSLLQDNAKAEAQRSQRSLKEYERTLADKIDSLGLICRAMWELVRGLYNLSDEDLLNKVQEIDLSDGKLDGKVKVKPKKCSKCGRPLSRRRMRCLYCGSWEFLDSAFDTL